MAELKLTLAKQIDCGKCDDVLLWVHNPTLLVQNVGVTDPALINPFLEGSIVDIVAVDTGLVKDCLPVYEYEYTISYDENELVTPANLLTECDIRELCCAGCAIQYLQVRLANLEDIIATMQADIAQNTADIATNTADIATNAADIATNAADITALDGRVTTLEGFHP